MQVTYQYTLNDYLEGFKASRKRKAWSRWSFRIGIVVFVVALLVVCLLFIGNMVLKRPVYDNVLPLVGLIGFWLLVLWGSPYLSARSQFRGAPNAKTPLTLEATESGLRFQSIHSTSQLQWSALVAWVEEKSIFALFTNPRLFIPVPKRAFNPEQIKEFRELLRRSVQ